jgi:hypothetical protein
LEKRDLIKFQRIDKSSSPEGKVQIQCKCSGKSTQASDVAQSVHAECTIIDDDDSEEEKAAKLDAAIGIGIDSMAGELTITNIQELPQGSTAALSIKTKHAHFNSASQVEIGTTGITVNMVDFVSAEKLIINVTVQAEINAHTQHDITVTTPLSEGRIETVTGDKMLYITEPSALPEIISIISSSVKQGASNAVITLYAIGAHFDESSVVDFGDNHITVKKMTVHSENSLTAVLSIDSSAPKKLYNTTVITGIEVVEDAKDYGFLSVYQSALPEAPMPGTMQFYQENQIVRENIGTYAFMIERVGGSDNQVSVNYATKNGTANAGQDFVAKSGTLTWEAGDSEPKELTVTITNDSQFENDETFTIELLETADGASLGAANIATVVIENDDRRPASSGSGNSDSDSDDVDDFSDRGTDDDIDQAGPNSDDDSTEPDDKLNEPPVNPQPAKTNPNEPPLSPSHPDQIPFSPDNPDRIDENGIVDNAPLPSPSSSSSQICPEKGQVTSSCIAKGVIITYLKVAESGHIDGGTLKGTLENDGWVTNFLIESGSRFENNGWVSNLTIQPEAILIGSILTSYIVNEGTLIDIDFRGAYVIGGYLGGTILNNSKIGGYFKDVSLMPNTHIIGGALRGKIEGDPQYPALLESLRVRRNSHLSHVIIGPDVDLAENVTLGAGVVKMEKAVALNPTGEVDTQALMIGGSFINDGDFKQKNELSRSALITIHARIHVEPTHVGQSADILVCGAYRHLTSPKRKPLFYMIDTEDEIHLWDEEIVNLVTFREVESLGEVEDIEIYSGHFDFTGILNIYFGYRLEDGTIVYNLKTIDVSIME